MQVGAAEADGGDADDLLAGSGHGLGFLVDADVLGAMQSKHFHGRHDSGRSGPRVVRSRTGARGLLAYPRPVARSAPVADLGPRVEGVRID